MEHWHLTFAAPDRPTLLATDEELLDATRSLVRVTGRWAPLFCLVDEHGHTIVRGSREHAGRVAGWLLQALSAHVRQPLEPARIWPVKGNSHLETLIGYVCDQASHHDLQLDCHPALWPGSCFQDLVGARILPGYQPELLRQALPRLTEARIWGALRLPVVTPATDEALASAGPAAIATAALAAVGHSAFESRTPPVVQARRATASLGRRLGWDTSTVARLIATSARSARRLATEPVDSRVEQAVRLQIALRQACLAHPAGPTRRGRGKADHRVQPAGWGR